MSPARCASHETRPMPALVASGMRLKNMLPNRISTTMALRIQVMRRENTARATM